jgi:hypothetical protein
MTTPDPERATNAGAAAFDDGRIGEAMRAAVADDVRAHMILDLEQLIARRDDPTNGSFRG